MDKITTLKNIEITLNALEVRGEQNLNHLLGCIQTVRQVRAELEQEATNETCDVPTED